MKKQLILILVLFLMFISCSDKHSTDIIELSSSSFEVSSSSIENRLDIEYDDSISVEDINDLTLSYRAEPYAFYIGNLPLGSGISLSLESTAGNRIEYQVLSESNNVVYPKNIVIDESEDDASMTDSLYRNYIVSGLDSNSVSNSFYTTKDDYFYLTIKIDSTENDSVDIDLSVAIDSAKYYYVSDSLDIETNKTEHLVFSLFEGNKSTYLCFDVEQGKATDLKTEASPVDTAIVRDSDNNIVENSYGKYKIGTRLTPNEDDQYCIEYMTGFKTSTSPNYVLYSITVDNVDLPQGEYFSTADTITEGDTLDFAREENALAQYDVEYYHYMYLGNLSESNFYKFWYGAYGLSGNIKNLVLYKENESDSNFVKSFSIVLGEDFSVSNGSDFTVNESGQYYLRFFSKNGSFTDTTNAVGMKMLFENLGSIDDLNIVKATAAYSVGDVINLDDFLMEGMQPNVIWEVPRSERDVIVDDTDLAEIGSIADSTGIDDGTDLIELGDEIDGQSITAFGAGTAHLIAVTVADLTVRDTCVITIE